MFDVKGKKHIRHNSIE